MVNLQISGYCEVLASHLYVTVCRDTTMALYIFSLLGMVVYTFTLSTREIGIVYVTGALLGLVQVFTIHISTVLASHV
jgi:hypothetical protein